MIKSLKILFIYCFVFLLSKITAQTNLVINPSFEMFTGCPSSTSGEINKAIGWDTCRNSADYFNFCGITSDVQIPKNYFGFQYPLNGNAYCGFATYSAGSPSGPYREMIIGQLSAALVVSQKYYISYSLSRADSNTIVGYSTNNTGIKFTKVKQSYVPVNNSAHFFNNNIISDTVTWTKQFGSFIADSAYNFIMIGNFFDDSNTNTFNHGNGVVAYYYIDDICVSTDSLFTKNYATSLNNFSYESETSIFPNPAEIFFTLSNHDECEIIVSNVLGDIIFKTLVKSTNQKIDCTSWASGIYFIKSSKNKFKIIVDH
ncbi:MAG: T9SS type A sorting domain-containing protein [Bacteroidia bacterium]|nr:T9SS type A sorting domain-containing protein [Bacteroidia bacterium]